MFVIVNSNGDHNRTTYSKEMKKIEGRHRCEFTRTLASGAALGVFLCVCACVCLCGAEGVTATMTISFLTRAPCFWFVRWAAVPTGNSPKPLSVSRLDDGS